MAIGGNATLGLTFVVNGTAASLATVNAFKGGVVAAAADMERRWGGPLDALERRISGIGGSIERGLTRSFVAAAGAVGVLTYAFTGLSRSFVEVNQKFSEFEITLGSSLKSVKAAREIVNEVAKITATSPIPFKDIAESITGLTVLPQLNARFSQQAREGTLSDPNGLTRRSIQLVEMMTAFRPDKRPDEAIFSIREALTGEFRSLQRRFDVPLSILTDASNKSVSRLKSEGPDAIFDALYKAFGNIISPEAVKLRAQQPSVVLENLYEQLFQQPSLSVGRSGFMNTVGRRLNGYLGRSAGFFTNNPDDPESGQFEKEGFAAKISISATRMFDSIFDTLETSVDKILKSYGFSEGSVLERSSLAVAGAFEYAAENLPQWIDQAVTVSKKLFELLRDFTSTLATIVTFFLNITKTMGPYGTLATAVFAPKIVGMATEAILGAAARKIAVPVLSAAGRGIAVGYNGVASAATSVGVSYFDDIKKTFGTFGEFRNNRDRLNNFHLSGGAGQRVKDYADIFNSLGMTQNGRPFNYNTRASQQDIFDAEKTLSSPFKMFGARLVAVVGPMIAFTAAISLATYTVNSFREILKIFKDGADTNERNRDAMARSPESKFRDAALIAASRGGSADKEIEPIRTRYDREMAIYARLDSPNEYARANAARYFYKTYGISRKDLSQEGFTNYRGDITTAIASQATRGLSNFRGDDSVENVLKRAYEIRGRDDLLGKFGLGDVNATIFSQALSGAQGSLMPLLENRIKIASPNDETVRALEKFNSTYKEQQSQLAASRELLSTPGLAQNMLARLDESIRVVAADINTYGDFRKVGGENVDLQALLSNLKEERKNFAGSGRGWSDGYTNKVLELIRGTELKNRSSYNFTNLGTLQDILAGSVGLMGQASTSQRPELMRQLRGDLSTAFDGDSTFRPLLEKALEPLGNMFTDTSLMDGLAKFDAELADLAQQQEYFTRVNDLAAKALEVVGENADNSAEIMKLENSSRLQMLGAQDNFIRKLREYDKILEGISLNAAARGARDELRLIRDARSRGYRVSTDHMRNVAENYSVSEDLSPTDQLRSGFGSQFLSGDDFGNLATVGIQSAQAIKGAFSDALFSIAMNAKNAGDAFRAMAASIAESMARILANKAAESLLSMIFGSVFNFGGMAASGASGANFSGTSLTPQTGAFSGGTFTGTSASFGGAFAKGGEIKTGSGTKDDVHILAMRGEYVLNRKAVQALGIDRLNAWNNGQVYQYANGGHVGPSVSSTPYAAPSYGPQVNLTVNYNGGNKENSSGQTDSAGNAELSRALEAAVVQVIEKHERSRRFSR